MRRNNIPRWKFDPWSNIIDDVYAIHLVLNSGDTAKNYLQKEVEILRTKNHWKKAYFYLWDEV